MKFYNRDTELELLQTLHEQSKRQARMTVLTGRRRMGKTYLSIHFAKDQKYLYLFVAKKSESLLCEEYLAEIKEMFNIPVVGKISTFKEIFHLLLDIGKKEHLTVIIDEFQEFFNINPSIYSDMQKLWDLNKKSKLHFIAVGSVYSLMHKIFEDNKEPLFGRADRIIHLKSFRIQTLSTILKDNKIKPTKSLFDYYVFINYWYSLC